MAYKCGICDIAIGDYEAHHKKMGFRYTYGPRKGEEYIFCIICSGCLRYWKRQQEAGFGEIFFPGYVQVTAK